MGQHKTDMHGGANVEVKYAGSSPAYSPEASYSSPPPYHAPNYGQPTYGQTYGNAVHTERVTLISSPATTNATTGLVLGILALLVFCGLPISIGALKLAPPGHPERGLAIGGLVMNIIALCAWILIVIPIIIVFAVMGASIYY